MDIYNMYHHKKIAVLMTFLRLQYIRRDSIDLCILWRTRVSIVDTLKLCSNLHALYFKTFFYESTPGLFYDLKYEKIKPSVTYKPPSMICTRMCDMTRPHTTSNTLPKTGASTHMIYIIYAPHNARVHEVVQISKIK